ncbi:MAG: cytochrome P450 [Novosphingobium sp.]|nr:cytochrome P450 [Novosphingobium sp.]
MATLAEPAPRFSHWSNKLPKGALDHLPGEDGIPVFGTTLRLVADPVFHGNRMHATYGPVFRSHNFGVRQVSLIGPEANELVLFDREKVFSSEQGWGPALDRLFPRGLMLMDFEAHRVDRRALSIAFKPAPMRHYADALNRGIAEAVAQWGGPPMAFYPAIKQLTLDLAADSFLGMEWGAEAQKVNRAFVDLVNGSIGVIRKPWPLTAMGRGVAARNYLVELFTVETLKRRETGGGQDMFSQFANATREDGSLLAVDEVVDHMIFLMLAAHDTITSGASSLLHFLLAYDDLPRMQLTEMAFREALRLIPPVPSTPRRALKDFTFGGYRIPAGTQVGISAQITHKMPEHWPDPERFDPMRFTPEATARRHKYAWIPFGGGAHMCLGLHFAYLQVKVLMAHLLTRYAFELEPGYEPQWAPWPIPKPKDGMRMIFRPRDG